jgi:hypothetical protein
MEHGFRNGRDLHLAEETFCSLKRGAWYKAEDCYARKVRRFVQRRWWLLQRVTPAEEGEEDRARSPPVEDSKAKQVNMCQQERSWSPPMPLLKIR